MVVLKKLPGQDIIKGFRGKIDFYIYHASCDPEIGAVGIPVARSWPSPPSGPRAPLVQAQWPAWTFASKSWNYLSPLVQDAQESGMSGRDLYTKSFISDYFRKDQWESLTP